MTDPILEPIPLSQDEIDMQETRALQAQIAMTLNTVIQNIARAFDMYWNNPKSSPQAQADKLGNGALKLFTSLETWQEAIKAVYPDYVPLVPPQSWQANKDENGNYNGTITTPIPEVVP